MLDFTAPGVKHIETDEDYFDLLQIGTRKISTDSNVQKGDDDDEDNLETDLADLIDGVVIDFWAPWCGPCKAIKPFYEKLAIENPSIIFASVDVVELESLANELDIKSLPTFVFYKRDDSDGGMMKAQGVQLGADRKSLEQKVKLLLD